MRRAFMLFGAFWPPIYMVFFIALIVEATIRGGGDPDNDLLIPFGVLIGLHLATMLLMLGAAVAYVLHAWRNPRVPQDQRVLWLVVILLGAPIAIPIYWWIYLRPGSENRRTPVLG
ncbi:hypothetical protein OJ997_15165 [Solirubrobacter phytolaccae]|uniref:Cardiolipin synthase N-terminal domain-containing protein n=1 Tax=Solirubrobacter phytolaccae TaxID=1404360 RepID=A0A9X3NAR4_9ACTN|nr:hypothetical protein [Solirubrobacter phytolaccae]MDA0181644.1 hypothetical protein [Solirubrobacter phytolaccae]